MASVICSYNSCNNVTTDPSGSCHHHRGKSSNPNPSLTGKDFLPTLTTTVSQESALHGEIGDSISERLDTMDLESLHVNQHSEGVTAYGNLISDNGNGKNYQFNYGSGKSHEYIRIECEEEEKYWESTTMVINDTSPGADIENVSKGIEKGIEKYEESLREDEKVKAMEDARSE